MKYRFGMFAAFLCAMVIALSARGAQVTIDSPQKLVQGVVTVDGEISLDLNFCGRTVLTDSPLGLTFEDGAYGPLALLRTETRQINSRWENRFGRSRVVRDRAVEVTVYCKETTAPNRQIAVVLRAYDDGFAFRYVVPGEEGYWVLTQEKTRCRFDSDLTCWAANVKKLDTSSEARYEKTRLGELSAEGIYTFPLVVTGDFGCAALAEAGVTDWPKAHLRSVPGENAVSVGFTPRKDGNHLAAGSWPLQTPWRVVLLGKTAVDLVNNSGVILNLNPPCAIAEDDWIRPGASSWDWWAHSNSDLTIEHFKEKVDLAARMGWPYTTLDAPWYGSRGVKREKVMFEGELLDLPKDGQVDILSGREDFDIDEALRYAKEKGVGVFLWLYRADLRACGEERAFRFYHDKGVAGLKIDFLDREDQEMVEWVTKTLRLAAKYHLMINFHGIYPPSGVNRTWPNFITQEGILGNEYNKWSDQVTPVHSLTLPYTRYLLGPGDFTPGGFLNRHRETFKAQNGAANDACQMGTRALALAQCVIYDSPLMTLCDTPEHYLDAAGTQMLKNLPACWDESIALAGDIGDYIVMARRSGRTWYLAAMNAGPRRSVDVTLDFLPEGTAWNADLYTDAPDSDENAEALAVSREVFQAGQTVTIDMAREGGWNAVLTEE